MKRELLKFYAKIKPIKPLNDEFTLCKVYVQGIGKNRNYSYMNKDSVLKNIATLFYVPVVGHLLKDEDGETYFGSHDYEISCDENGLKIKSLTVPFGVVCENQYDFEVINEYGVDVEYLVSNAILWTGRYPELKEAIYSDETWFNQSMEITPSQTRPCLEDSNYIEILDWTYSALCILGKADENSTNGKTDLEKNTEPCFINSKIEPYNFNSNEFSKQLAVMKKEIALVFENINNNEKGGLPLTNKKNIADENIVEVIEENIEPTVEETINVEVLDTPAPNIEEAESIENEVVNDSFDVNTYSSTYKQKREALDNALKGTVTKDENGELIGSISYWVNDFDDTYVYVEKETYLQGNFDCEKGCFKYAYDEVNLIATIESDFEKMVVTWLTIEENELIQSERNKIDVELNELKEFKLTVTSEKRKSEIDNIFAKFDNKLSGFAEYETLKESEITMDITELEEKLFAMIGKKTTNFSVHPKETVVTVPVETYESTDDDGYGGILAKKYNN